MEWDSGKSISFGFRLVLIFGLSAVALFMVGPEMGSLDLDHDGIPETTVAVLSRRPVFSLSKSLRAIQRRPSEATVVLPFTLIDAVGSNQFVATDPPQSTAHSHALYVLRC